MGSYYNNVKLKPDPNQHSNLSTLNFNFLRNNLVALFWMFLVVSRAWHYWFMYPNKIFWQSICWSSFIFPLSVIFYWTLNPLWRHNPSCPGLCSDLHIHHIFLSCHGTQWGQEILHLKGGRHPNGTNTEWESLGMNSESRDRHLVFDFSAVIEWAQNCGDFLLQNLFPKNNVIILSKCSTFSIIDTLKWIPKST